MNLIQAEENTPALTEWAQRLGIDLNQPRVVAIVEVDSGQLGVDKRNGGVATTAKRADYARA